MSGFHARELADCRATDKWRTETVGGLRRDSTMIAREKAVALRTCGAGAAPFTAQ